MGMAASQARFLNLTSRKSDLEYQAQQIHNAKLSIADKTQNLSQQYNAKLNDTALYVQTDTNGLQSMNYRNLTNTIDKGGLNLTLVNSKGQVVVPNLGSIPQSAPVYKQQPTENFEVESIHTMQDITADPISVAKTLTKSYSTVAQKYEVSTIKEDQTFGSSVGQLDLQKFYDYDKATNNNNYNTTNLMSLIASGQMTLSQTPGSAIDINTLMNNIKRSIHNPSGRYFATDMFYIYPDSMSISVSNKNVQQVSPNQNNIFVYNAAQLKEALEENQNNKDVNIMLMADIDMRELQEDMTATNVTNWQAVDFAGTLYGNGYAINHLTMIDNDKNDKDSSSDMKASFFNTLTGTIRDVFFEGMKMEDEDPYWLAKKIAKKDDGTDNFNKNYMVNVVLDQGEVNGTTCRGDFMPTQDKTESMSGWCAFISSSQCCYGGTSSAQDTYYADKNIHGTGGYTHKDPIHEEYLGCGPYYNTNKDDINLLKYLGFDKQSVEDAMNNAADSITSKTGFTLSLPKSGSQVVDISSVKEGYNVRPSYASIPDAAEDPIEEMLSEGKVKLTWNWKEENPEYTKALQTVEQNREKGYTVTITEDESNFNVIFSGKAFDQQAFADKQIAMADNAENGGDYQIFEEGDSMIIKKRVYEKVLETDNIVVDKDLLDESYLQEMIRSGQLKFLQTETDSSNVSTKKKEWTELSQIQEKLDTTNDQAALAEYESAKDKMEKEEKILDLELDRLETERSAITTELDSISQILKDNIKNSYNTCS